MKRLHTQTLPIRFRGEGSQDRLVWSHAAHDLLGERLYFYIISSQDTRTTRFRKAVVKIFEDMRVLGYSLYVAYGSVDLMLQVYLTDAQKRALLRSLLNPAADFQIESAFEFKTTEVVGQLVRPENPNAERQRVARDAQLLLMPDGEQNQGIIDELMQSGYVEVERQTHPHRCYMFLSSEDAVSESGLFGFVKSLSAQLKDSDVSDIRAYRGEGFCDLVLDFSVYKYLESLPIIEQIQDIAEDYGYFGWSLFPPEDRSVTRADWLNSIQPQVSKDVVDMLGTELIKPNEHRSLARNLEAFATTVESLVEICSSDESRVGSRGGADRVFGILGAVIARSRKALNRSLSFLISIEQDIREISLQIDRGEIASIQPSRGKSLERLLTEICGDPNLLDRSQVVRDTAGINYTGILSELYMSESQVQTIVALRDEYAHGQLVSSLLQANQAGLFEYMQRILYAIDVQVLLEVCRERFTEMEDYDIL